MEEKKEYKNEHIEKIKSFAKTYCKEMLITAQVVLNSGIEKAVFDNSCDLDDLTHKSSNSI